jgi:hypothetical protein
VKNILDSEISDVGRFIVILENAFLKRLHKMTLYILDGRMLENYIEEE